MAEKVLEALLKKGVEHNVGYIHREVSRGEDQKYLISKLEEALSAQVKKNREIEFQMIEKLKKSIAKAKKEIEELKGGDEISDFEEAANKTRTSSGEDVRDVFGAPGGPIPGLITYGVRKKRQKKIDKLIGQLRYAKASEGKDTFMIKNLKNALKAMRLTEQALRKKRKLRKEEMGGKGRIFRLR